MPSLPGFWHAAAALSGRVDFAAVVAASPDDPSRIDAPGLARLGVRLDHAARLVTTPPLEDAGDWMRLGDPRYPALLAAVPFAPPVLFWRGELGLLDAPCAAVVGTRRCTAQGEKMARFLAAGLSQAGVVVVSGLAHGIDSHAHASAIPRTVAVLGQGLGTPLTPTQDALARRILAAGGLLLCEFAPAWPPSRHSFPQRNRVIAGLAAVTVVVEAGYRSGALITARQALAAGREVMAVPGHPLSDGSGGCLDLIANGAAMARSAGDVIEALGARAPAARDPLLEAIGDGCSFDALVERTGRAPADLLRALAALEVAGLVSVQPGDRYVPACRLPTGPPG